MNWSRLLFERRVGAARQCAAAVLAILIAFCGWNETARAQKRGPILPSFDMWLDFHARFVYVATPIRLWNPVWRHDEKRLELLPYDQKVLAPDYHTTGPASPYLEVHVLEVLCAGPEVDVKGMPKRLFIYMDRFGSMNDLGLATTRLLGQGDFVFLSGGSIGWSFRNDLVLVNKVPTRVAASAVEREFWSEQIWPAMPVVDFDVFRARLAKSRTCLPL